MPLYSGLMILLGMEVLSNSRCSFLKIIRTNHRQSGLFHGCSIQTFMLMGVYVWTFSKTSGVQFMMSLLYLPPFSRYSVTLIRILLRIRKLHECSAKANGSTTEESARLLNKAGLQTSNNICCSSCLQKQETISSLVFDSTNTSLSCLCMFFKLCDLLLLCFYVFHVLS